jgi:hypothetical protein
VISSFATEELTMRMLTVTAAMAMTAWLCGCSKPASPDAHDATEAAAPGPVTDTGANKADAAKKPAKTIEIPTVNLAYAYADTVQAPPQALAGLLARHQAACVSAGPGLCEVTGSTYEARGRDDVEARLALRGDPAWIGKFKDQIGIDAKASGGRLAHANVTTEDLARQVIDVQATIRAKTALRDRLQTLLQTRPGKAAEFLEISTDLANVQAELDATQSELAAMQVRLRTSTLTIDYESDGVLAPEGAWAPLGVAVSQTSGILARTLAMMVTLVAMLSPWVLAIGGGVWIYRRKARKAGQPGVRPYVPPTPPESPAV